MCIKPGLDQQLVFLQLATSLERTGEADLRLQFEFRGIGKYCAHAKYAEAECTKPKYQRECAKATPLHHNPRVKLRCSKRLAGMSEW